MGLAGIGSKGLGAKVLKFQLRDPPREGGTTSAVVLSALRDPAPPRRGATGHITLAADAATAAGISIFDNVENVSRRALVEMFLLLV